MQIYKPAFQLMAKDSKMIEERLLDQNVSDSLNRKISFPKIIKIIKILLHECLAPLKSIVSLILQKGIC